MSKGVSVLIVGNIAVGKSVLARLLEVAIPGVVVVDDVCPQDLARVERLRTMSTDSVVVVTATTAHSEAFLEKLTGFDVVVKIEGGLGALLMQGATGTGLRAILSCVGERRRQEKAEGYDSAHDDLHTDGELAQAAAYYALPEFVRKFPAPGGSFGFQIWPWSEVARKPSPTNRKREVEKAVGLLLSEWERLDRAEKSTAGRARE